MNNFNITIFRIFDLGIPRLLSTVWIVFILISNTLYSQHSLKKHSYPINTNNLDEICPVVSYDQQTLYFTRVADPMCEKTLFVDSFDISKTMSDEDYNKKLKSVYSQIASSNIEEPINSGYNQDIWYSQLVNGQPKGIYHPGYPINDVLPNSICSNFGKTNSFLVVNQFARHGGIERGFSSTIKDGESFSFPEPIQIMDFNKSGAEVNITASIDSSVLILSMVDSAGMGDMDIYVCFRLGENKYSMPINLGNDINTSYRESTPMLTHDTKKLFFTSDRPGGFGGKDIYYSERKDFSFTSWTSPKKLNPPVNTRFDDSHPHLMNDNNTIFFTSNRDGSSDIFQAKLIRDKIVKDLIINVRIINGELNRLAPGELIWGQAYQNERPGYFRSKDGLCRYKFFENKPIVFKAVNRNIESEEVLIDPQELINEGKYEMTLELVMYGDGRMEFLPKDTVRKVPFVDDKISEEELSKTVLLNNIYFERTRAVVLPESYPALQKLADVLLVRPKLYIQIIGHTDNVGDTEALKKLSEDRALAIKEILIEKGVPDEKVTTKGFGGAKPIAPNDTEENKSKNRRVEIKIVSQ